MINNLRMSSRSVSNDLFFQRTKNKEMQMHRQKLQQIRRAPVIPHQKNKEAKLRLKQINKSKQAFQKIDSIFDPVKLENKAMIQKISKIQHRRSSMFEVGSSLKNLHNYRSYKQQQEKKQLKKQNLRMISKILQERSKITTKKQLKQQFKQYQTRRQNLRKVHSKSHF